MYPGSTQASPAPEGARGKSNGAQSGTGGPSPTSRTARPVASANGHKAVDFVSEDDVRQAIQKGEKIYITAKTIITPAARDMADPAEVFAKI